MEIRTRNRRYSAIGKRLIRRRPELAYIRNSAVRIAFLASDHEKTKDRRTIFGECEKIPEKYKWRLPYDFTITIFEPNVERFTGRQLEILILHELLHVGIEVDGFEEKYYIEPHDIEEFYAIINQYGMDWSKDEQAGEAEES